MSCLSNRQPTSTRGLRRVGEFQDYFWVAAIAALYLFLFVRVQWRIGDEGDMLNGALAVSEGRIPYRDFFDLRGPAAFYWLGLFFKVFGATWFVARMHLLMTGTLTALLVYHLARRVSRSSGALLPCAIVTVLSIPAWPASHHHWDSNLFALAAIAAFFSAQERGGRTWFFLSGAVAGLSSCFIYQKGFFLLASFIAVLALGHIFFRRRADVGQVAAMLGGYGAVGVAVLAWFIHLGALQDFLAATIVNPVQTYADQNRLSYGYQLTEFAFGKLPALSTWSAVLALPSAALLMAPAVVIGGLPILVIALAALYMTDSKNRKEATFPLAAYVIVGAGLWLSEYHRPDIMHLIYGSPVLLVALWLMWRQINWPQLLRIGVPATLVVGILFTAIVQGLRAVSANQETPSRRGTVLGFEKDQALRFLVSDQVHPGDFVFVYPYYPTYYFLANIRNPTRFGEFIYGPGSKPYFDEAIQAIESHKVKFVLWDTVVTADNMQRWFPAYVPPPRRDRWMENYLSEHYEQIDVLSGFRILRRK